MLSVSCSNFLCHCKSENLFLLLEIKFWSRQIVTRLNNKAQRELCVKMMRTNMTLYTVVNRSINISVALLLRLDFKWSSAHAIHWEIL